MERVSVKAMLERGSPGESVAVQGWVRSARHSKGVSFLEVSDGSCFAGIQVVADPELPNYESEVKTLGTGCAIIAEGELVESPGKGQRLELRAAVVTKVGGVEDDYPLQKKRHSFEFLRTIAHLRPRTNTIGAVWRVRNVAARAIHDFFQERGFVWLHTPVLTAADAEGAGEMFELAGSEIIVTWEHLAVAGFIAVFSGLQFAVSMLTDATYRDEFYEDVTGEIREVLAVRVLYHDSARHLT